MKKFAYVIAAVVGFALAAPTLASAETVVIKRGHHHHGWHHGGWRHHHYDHGWHHGWRHHHHRGAKIVIRR
jgi:hypothetical protein